MYALGQEYNVSATLTAKIWKNGVPTSLSDGTNHAYAKSLFINGNDVYVSGMEVNSSGKLVAKYWKNGVKTNLTNGTYDAYSSAIVVTTN